MPASLHYWLVKSEPTTFSFDDLLAAPKKTTQWDGVRNHRARNNLREMKTGDRVLFYHSSADPTAVVGIAEVVREAYPDPSAFDPKEASPTWVMVDLKAVEKLARPVTLAEIKATKSLAEMELVRLGRLSVQSVTPTEFETVLALASRRGD